MRRLSGHSYLEKSWSTKVSNLIEFNRNSEDLLCNVVNPTLEKNLVQKNYVNKRSTKNNNKQVANHGAGLPGKKETEINKTVLNDTLASETTKKNRLVGCLKCKACQRANC